jgi:endonuclease/exonuclease/phosphatase family metal-dependent hydrolase
MAAFLIGGCGSEGISPGNDDSPGLPEPELPEPDFTYAVMTYNILGGADVGCEGTHIGAEPGDRLEEVIGVIEMIDPDILGIQEANCWKDSEAGTARQVAERLGMDHFLGDADPTGGEEPGLEHVVLFTKFEISEAENYPEPFTRGTMRAELQPSWGEPINVFVTHLFPEGGLQWAREFGALAEQVRQYAGQKTLVIGDFNALPEQIDFGPDFVLIGGGLVDWIYGERSVGLGPSGHYYFRRLNTGLTTQALFQISDHLPVAVMIGVYR